MASCRDIESNLSAYVDGETTGLDRATIDAHLRVCPPCRTRASAERTAHEVICARRQDLRACAPAHLRERCAAQRAAARPAATLRRRSWVPMSLAASFVLAVGTILLFTWGSSVETYAAQLAVDHVKCFRFPADAGAVSDVTMLGRTWKEAHGWPLKVAAGSEREQLQLIGMRRCGSTKGRVAHVLYKWKGQPLSVYVLNGTLNGEDGLRADGSLTSVSRFGENALMWSAHGRTYSIVTALPAEPDLLHLVDYMRRNTE